MKAREVKRDSPRGEYPSGSGRQSDSAGEDEEAELAGEDVEGEAEQLPEEARETAAAALQLLGTGFSPVVPRPLSVAPLYHDTPKSLLPIPPSLRASEEPEEQQRRQRGQAVQQPKGGRQAQQKRRHQHQQQQTAAPDYSGWRCCGVCGMRLDSRPPWGVWHPAHQHLRQHPADPRRDHLIQLACALAGLWHAWAACGSLHWKNPTLQGMQCS